MNVFCGGEARSIMGEARYFWGEATTDRQTIEISGGDPSAGRCTVVANTLRWVDD